MITSSKFFNKTIFYQDDLAGEDKLDDGQWQPDTTHFKQTTPHKNNFKLNIANRKYAYSQNRHKTGHLTLDNASRRMERTLLPQKSIKQIKFSSQNTDQPHTKIISENEVQKYTNNSIWLPKVSHRHSLSYRPQHLRDRKLSNRKDPLNFIGRKKTKNNPQLAQNYHYYSKKIRQNMTDRYQSLTPTPNHMKQSFVEKGSKYDIYDHCTQKITSKYKKFEDANIFSMRKKRNQLGDLSVPSSFLIKINYQNKFKSQ